MKKLIDVYPYHLSDEGIRFLLLKRAGDKIYSGQWRMIGGKVRENESRWEAAIRELEEETGVKPDIFWTVPTVNHFYEHDEDQVHIIPAFAAEFREQTGLTLNTEHKAYEWVAVDQIKNYIFWPEQKRIIDLIHSIVQKDQILKDWIINFRHT